MLIPISAILNVILDKPTLVEQLFQKQSFERWCRS